MNFFVLNLQSIAAGIGDWIYCILSIFPKIFYLLCNAFITIIDFLQFLFRKFAGLEVYYVESASGTLTPQEGDVVYQFLFNIILGNQYPLLSNVFWAMIVLAVILLFVSTLIAIIRKDYNYDAKDNAKGPIVGQAIKSLAFIAMVPIIVLFGVYLTNVLLKAVDSASSPQRAESLSVLDNKFLEPYALENGKQSYIAYNFFGAQIGTTTTPFSAYIFETCAHNANRVRINNSEIISNGETLNGGFLDLLQNGAATNFGGMFTGDNAEIVATKIDEAFMGTVTVTSQYATKLDFRTSDWIDKYNLTAVDPFMWANENITYKTFDRNNVTLMWYYYDLWFFNYFIAIGAGILLGAIMLNITIAMLGRIVEMIALFLVYAPLLGFAPMDNQKAFGSWRDNFIKKTLMAFGAVVGMNILFIILPYLGDIKFFGNFPGAEVANGIVTVMLIFVGLQMVKGFIGLISGFVGGDDANKTGGEVGKDLASNLVKAGKATAMLAGGVGGVALAGVGAARAGIGIGRGLKGTYNENKKIGAKFLHDEGMRRGRERDAKQMELENQYYEQEIDNAAFNQLKTSGLKTSSGKDYSTLTDEQWEVEKQTENYKSHFTAQRTAAAADAAVISTARANAAANSNTNADAAMVKAYGANWSAPEAREFKNNLVFGENSYRMNAKKGMAHELKQGIYKGYGAGYTSDSISNFAKFANSMFEGSDFYSGLAGDQNFHPGTYFKESNIPWLSKVGKAWLKNKKEEDIIKEVNTRMAAEKKWREDNPD